MSTPRKPRKKPARPLLLSPTEAALLGRLEALTNMVVALNHNVLELQEALERMVALAVVVGPGSGSSPS